MWSERSLWDMLRDTRLPESSENRAADGRFVKVGRFSMLQIAWTAESEGPDGKYYTLAAVERDPEHWSAVRRGAEPTLSAAVAEYTPAKDGRGATLATYAVQIASGKLMEVDGTTQNAYNYGAGLTPTEWALPRELPSTDTVLSLNNVLRLAHFEPRRY